MRELAILTFVSLDGVMQAPMSPDEDASGDFIAGGWAAPFAGQAMAQVQRHAMHQPYDLLFGRKTYDQFASYWPQQSHDDPIARLLNHARKYVVTSSQKPLVWQYSTAINGEIVTEIEQLKRQEGPLLQVHGSWQLIQTLLAHGLVDLLRLWTFPVVLGAGKRLFEQGVPQCSFKLERAASCDNGVLMQLYRQPK